jgi:hypothetical protein
MLQKELLAYGLGGLLAVGVLLHSFFPRYDWKTVEQSGSISVVVYDRWTGRFQRGVYDNGGNLNVMGVFTPF